LIRSLSPSFVTAKLSSRRWGEKEILIDTTSNGHAAAG
jgi:hypothetical protein